MELGFFVDEKTRGLNLSDGTHDCAIDITDMKRLWFSGDKETVVYPYNAGECDGVRR